MTGPTFNLELDRVIDNLIDEWVENKKREAEQLEFGEEE